MNLLDFASIGDEVTIVFEVTDCRLSGHFGYAYIDANCFNFGIETNSEDICIYDNVIYSNAAIGSFSTESYLWKFYDLDGSILDSSNLANPNMTYFASGIYKVILDIDFDESDPNSCHSTFESEITINGCNLECDTCSSFQPEPGEYWLSAWLKVNRNSQVKSYNPNDQVNTLNNNNLSNYIFPYIHLNFVGNSTLAYQFFPTGEIIDGWQRIVGRFKFQSSASVRDLELTLVADEVYDTYFDDIRIHPFNASMKSYVYDGETFWLSSELDDNNYATFYEYDQEGGLIRIKKETARGIVTIQETRSNTVKKN
jgi:hypothetical protein